MDTPLENRLAAELEPGERILWSGRPKQGFVLRGSDAFLIPFSLLWGGLAIHWEIVALKVRVPETFPHNGPISFMPILFRLWGIPFVVVGLWLMIGRFITDAYARAKTIYGVTDRRVLIVTWFGRTTQRMLDLRMLSDLSLSEGRGGVGTVNFGNAGLLSARDPFPGTRSYARPALELIEQPRRVYEIIREAQRKLG